MYVYCFKTLRARQAPLDTWDYLGTLRPVYMHSRTPVGLLRPGIIKDHSDTGEITRMSKKRVQTGSFSDYIPLLIEAKSSSCSINTWSEWYLRKVKEYLCTFFEFFANGALSGIGL